MSKSQWWNQEKSEFFSPQNYLFYQEVHFWRLENHIYVYIRNLGWKFKLGLNMTLTTSSGVNLWGVLLLFSCSFCIIQRGLLKPILLNYNLHTIICTHFKCTVQWLLTSMYNQISATSWHEKWKTFVYVTLPSLSSSSCVPFAEMCVCVCKCVREIQMILIPRHHLWGATL